MKMRIIALALALMAPATAFAGTLENFFGNTVVVRTADGQETRYHYLADGTYAVSTGGTTANGVWTNGGEGICLTPDSGAPRCFRLPDDEKHIGDTWTVPGPNGDISIQLVAGE